jgi:hypothetical protein
VTGRLGEPGRLPAGATVRCPACQAANDGYTGTNGADTPEPGAVGICSYCATLAVYDTMPAGYLGLRRPTQGELREMLADDNVRNALRVAARVSKQLPPRSLVKPFEDTR